MHHHGFQIAFFKFKSYQKKQTFIIKERVFTVNQQQNLCLHAEWINNKNYEENKKKRTLEKQDKY